MSPADPTGGSSGPPRPRRPLFYKYFIALFVAVVVPLLANGASEAWLGYRDQRSMLSARMHAEAVSAVGKKQPFSTTSPTSCNGRCSCPGEKAWKSGTASTSCV
jgi:hypothetical protein